MNGMVNPEKKETKESGECVMCRFVLLFAVAVLLLVASFVYFFQLGPDAEPLKPIPAEEVERMSPEELNQRILDLGQTLHGTPAPEVTTTSFGQPLSASETGIEPEQ